MAYISIRIPNFSETAFTATQMRLHFYANGDRKSVTQVPTSLCPRIWESANRSDGPKHASCASERHAASTPRATLWPKRAELPAGILHCAITWLQCVAETSACDAKRSCKGRWESRKDQPRNTNTIHNVLQLSPKSFSYNSSSSNNNNNTIPFRAAFSFCFRRKKLRLQCSIAWLHGSTR